MGDAVGWPPGYGGIVRGGCSLFQCYLPPVAVGSGLFCSCFPVISSPGDKLRRVTWQSYSTRSLACSADGALIANGTDFILLSPSGLKMDFFFFFLFFLEGFFFLKYILLILLLQFS